MRIHLALACLIALAALPANAEHRAPATSELPDVAQDADSDDELDQEGLSFWAGASAGFKHASFDASHRLDGSDRTSGSLGLNGAIIGLDGRIHFPRGSMPLPLFLTLMFGYMPSFTTAGLYASLHPTAGDDTRLWLRERWMMRALLGGEVWRLQHFTMALLAGMQIARLRTELATDESGGGGIRNVFERNRVVFGPVIGAEINRRLFSRLLLFVAFQTAFMSELNGKGTSAVNALPYSWRVDDGIQMDVRMGLLFRFY